jgi:hypothetical protein
MGLACQPADGRWNRTILAGLSEAGKTLLIGKAMLNVHGIIITISKKTRGPL